MGGRRAGAAGHGGHAGGPAARPARAGPLDRVAVALAEGRLADARTALDEAAVRLGETTPEVLAARARLAGAEGDRRGAAEHLATLRRCGATDPSAESLAIRVGLELGCDDAAVGAALAHLERAPNDGRVWTDLTLRVPRTAERVEQVLAVTERALASNRLDDTTRAHVLVTRANWQLATDTPSTEILETALRAAALGASPTHAATVARNRPDLDDAAVEVSVGRIGRDDRQREAWLDVIQRGRSSDDVLDRRLRHHLDLIARSCRDHHARLVLMTYPERTGRDRAVREFAAARGVPLIDLGPVFDRALEQTPHDALFVADGHCTGRGYGVVARTVRDWLIGRAEQGR